MRPDIVHLAVQEPPGVIPLCGTWGDSTNWTFEPAIVTCPACRASAGASAGASDAGGGAGPAARRGDPPTS